MNIIINNCKQGMNRAINLIQNCDNFLRRYATISDYKITWVPPRKVSNLSPEKTGDQGLEINIKSSDSLYQSHELKDANEIVKKMFTFEFLPHKVMNNARKEKILELVKRHEIDRKSPEARIALMTGKIYQLREHMENNPYNSRAKVILKETIDKRRKWLKHLRTWDYRRFEWVLEKLNLIYKPLPTKPWKLTRKNSLTQLTRDHCNKIIEDKLNAYKKELKALQKDFYIEKAEKLEFIRKEELFYGLKPSVTEKDIKIAKQKVEECKT